MKSFKHYLGFKEVQTKTTIIYHTFLPEWLKLKYLKTSNVEDMEQLELPYVIDGNVKWHIHFGKRSGSFL